MLRNFEEQRTGLVQGVAARHLGAQGPRLVGAGFKPALYAQSPLVEEGGFETRPYNR